MHRGVLAVFCIGLALALCAPTQAAERVALVIGNGGYAHANTLPNPPNDARAVAAALKEIDFEVVEGIDLNHAEMQDKLRDFLGKAASARVSLLFYAGHGLQVDGHNYLVPVDAKLASAGDLNFRTVELDKVLASLDDPSRANIIILDACRDNPLARSFATKVRSSSVNAGLAAYTSLGTGSLIAFATAPGKVAADGLGVNSPFTASLVKHLRTPGLEVRQMLTRVRNDVARATADRQIPWDNSSLRGDVYLAGRGPTGPTIADDSQLTALQKELEALKQKLQQKTEEPEVAIGVFPRPSPSKEDTARNNPFDYQPEMLRPAVFPPGGPAKPGRTLSSGQARGELLCGVNVDLSGFSAQDNGKWRGIDADFCRAASAAIFGSPDKVKYIPLSAKERFTALQSGAIDVLARNTTRTDTRENDLGLDFVGPNFYDGTAFMIRKSLGVTSALELNGASVCLTTGTTTELEIANFFQRHGMQYEVVAMETYTEMVKAYLAGRCDIYATDGTGLAYQRSKLASPDDHIILPERISLSPLGPWVREGDDQWLTLMRWTLLAMVRAEELGISSANLQAMRTSGDPHIKSLLGTDGGLGRRLGVSDDWALNVLKHVGNYGEVYARNTGQGTAMNMPRGLNELLRNGGLMTSAPLE